MRRQDVHVGHGEDEGLAAVVDGYVLRRAGAEVLRAELADVGWVEAGGADGG